MKKRTLKKLKRQLEPGLLDKRRVHFVMDTETGGLNPQYFGLLEVAFAVIINDKIVKRVDYNVYDSSKEYDEEALAINGYTEKQIKQFPKAEDVIQHIKEDIIFRYTDTYENTMVVPIGHNIEFDLRFLRRFFKDQGEGEFWDFNVDEENAIDTLKIARDLTKEGIITTPNHKLVTLAECFGKPTRGLHKAKQDVETTIEVLEHLLKLRKENTTQGETENGV